MLTLNWVFEYQPIVSGILTQPSRKRAESTLLADENGSQLTPGSCLGYASTCSFIISYERLIYFYINALLQ